MKVLYEDLLIKFSDSNSNLIIKEKNLPVNKGRIKGRNIAIRRNLTFKEKGCVLAEELGHHYTTVGNILDQSDAWNRKQELQARTWAYDETLGLESIIKAYKRGCKNLHEMAEHLEVTERFLADMLKRYEDRYGTHVEYGDYIITFIPSLNVCLK
jgi:hypothetical protein